MKYNKFAKILAIFLFLISLSSCIFDSGSEPEQQPDDQKFPHSPGPIDGKIDVPVSPLPTLTWECEDASSYSIRYGDTNPPLITANTGNKSILWPSFLRYNTVYYWQVTAQPSGNTGPVWRFTTQGTPGSDIYGYVLTTYDISTALPNYVNILFQVSDTDGKGVPGLGENDFIIYEDYAEIPFQEANVKLVAKPNHFKVQTVLMLDNSNSLNAAGIGAIASEARTFISNLLSTGNHSIAVYAFSAQTEMLTDFTDDPLILDAAISNYRLGALSTDLYGAVVEGASRVEDLVTVDQILQSFMVVFTDGSDTQGSTDFSDAMAAVNGKKVYTVGFGVSGSDGGPAYDPQVLESLGTAGFFEAADRHELHIKFQEISQEIDDFANSFYFLNYSSPKEGNRDHTLQITKTNNPISSFVEGYFNSRNFFHPNVRNKIYIVDLYTYEWYADGTTIDLPGLPRKYQAVTYLGSSYPFQFDYTFTSTSMTLKVDSNDPTNSSFYIENNTSGTGNTITVLITDLNNYPSGTPIGTFIFKR